MTARTHDAFAFASLVTLATLSPPENLSLSTLFVSVIASDIGSLIPDMDASGNRLWDLLPLGDSLGKFLRRVFYKHRTITHSIVGVVIIYHILQWILSRILNTYLLDKSLVLASLMLGYLSHLLADSLTEEGIPLFFPLRFNFGFPPIKSWRIKTGGWFEKFVVYPGVFIYLIWFVNANSEKILKILSLVNK